MSDGRPCGSEIRKPCANFSTLCDSMQYPYSVRSYRIYEFECTYTLPEKCGLWYIRITPNSGGFRRDSLLTNIPTGHWFYDYTNIDCNDTLIANNSAMLINPVPFFAPTNQNFSYSLKAYDPDGDSLTYHLTPTKDNFYGCGIANIQDIPYLAPYSISEPFATNGTFQWDSVNAIIRFNAPMAQNPIITLVINEYRSGVWVGSSSRDIPIVIMPVSNALPQNMVLTSSLNNVTLQGVDSFYMCTGLPMSFCTIISSTDSNAIIESSNTLATSIPNATLSYSNILTDSIMACISWAPTNIDTGWHNFTITAKDTTCPVLGVNTPQTFVYNIYVSNPPTPVIIKTGLLLSTSMFTTYQWNLNGNPILGATNQNYIVTQNGAYSVTVEDMSGCAGFSTPVIVNNVGVINVVASNALNLYPNPTNEKFIIESDENFNSVKIYTLLSQLVGEKKTKPTKKLEIGSVDLPAGIYLVNIDGKYIRKLVVEK